MNDEQAELAIKEICDLEDEKSQVDEHIRTKVMREGKRLRGLQKWQKGKQEQAKERGEQPKTWKEFVEETRNGTSTVFPCERACRQYMRISQFPGAYEKGMSVKEAYKMATAWKKNAGNPPLPSKVSISSRLANQVGVAAGMAVNKLEKYNSIEDWSVNAELEKWTDDDFSGMEETLIKLRKEIAISLNKIKRVREGSNA